MDSHWQFNVVGTEPWASKKKKSYRTILPSSGKCSKITLISRKCTFQDWQGHMTSRSFQTTEIPFPHPLALYISPPCPHLKGFKHLEDTKNGSSDAIPPQPLFIYFSFYGCQHSNTIPSHPSRTVFNMLTSPLPFGLIPIPRTSPILLSPHHLGPCSHNVLMRLHQLPFISFLLVQSPSLFYEPYQHRWGLH